MLRTLKLPVELALVVQVCISSTWEVKAGRQEFKDSLGYTRLHEILSQTNKQSEKEERLNK